MLRVAVTPETSLVRSGSTVTLTCLAYSNFEDTVVNFAWVYPPELEDVVTIENDVLTVDEIEGEANFTCLISLEGTGLSSTAMAAVFLGNA